MLWILGIVLLVAYFVIGGLFGIATNPNKQYPRNANVSDHLWVALVIIFGVPLGLLFFFF